MKTIVCILALALPFNALARSSDSQATLKDIEKTLGFVPGFLRALPDSALPGAWQEMKEFQMSPETALSPKVKELIGLAVASQIPCHYCIAAHTELARSQGATDDEIAETVAMAAHTRNFSSLLNGVQLDETAFKTDLHKLANRRLRTAQK